MSHNEILAGELREPKQMLAEQEYVGTCRSIARKMSKRPAQNDVAVLKAKWDPLRLSNLLMRMRVSKGKGNKLS